MAVPEVLPGLCPNCAERVADTTVDYYEVVDLSMSKKGGIRSWRKTWTSGKIRLCRQCADQYNRSVELRKSGRRLINWSFGLIIGGALLFLILFSDVPALNHGIGALIAALPVLLGFVMLVVSIVQQVIGNALRRSSTRFIANQLKRP
jgi:hypothetical protein